MNLLIQLIIVSDMLMQDPSQKTFQGDNFVRRAGDFDTFQALNLHSVAAMNRGQDISMMVGLLHTVFCFLSWN